MNVNKTLAPLIITFFLIFSHNESSACSMYKLTVEGKTMVGCNEDAWRTTSSIWFENAKNKNEYGAAFTGSRKVNAKQFAPQSGMNVVGLTFSRLTSYIPKKSIQENGKKEITDEVTYLTDILHKCATVEDAKRYIEQYDHSFFIDDVFIYIDSSGKYLVVEPYNLIEGNNPYYVLSNFCPSITNNEKARIIERYRNGEDFLKTHKIDASLSFCTALSDTMHVCRNRNGDGTLLTSIWDTENGLVNLFFYHAYDTTVQFNLAEELAKGDHILNIPDLFPKNSEFQRLTNYKTPFNTPGIRILMVVFGGILTLLSFLFISYLIGKNNSKISFKAIVLLSVLNLLLTAYLFVLATNINIYYFDAPYKHYSSNLISASSYIPFALLLSIVPITYYSFKLFKAIKIKRWIKIVLITNNLIYLILIMGFSYWGFFSILN